MVTPDFSALRQHVTRGISAALEYNLFGETMKEC